MRYSTNLTEDLEWSKTMLNEMIESAKKQGIINLQMLYVLDEALNYLLDHVKQNTDPSDAFLRKWDNIMGWAPKVFEDNPLLDKIRAIDKEICNG